MRCARQIPVFALLFAMSAQTVIADSSALVDMNEYTMAGANGGRGGLPEVKIWLKKSQAEEMKGGGHSWNYPDAAKPDNMHYSSWRFWQFGVSDALLQIICEQATDPSRKPAKLGPYFSQMTNSSLTCWSKDRTPRRGLVVDITDSTAVTESCRADHYVFYGLSDELYFQGSAKFYLKIDQDRHIRVVLVSSNLSEKNTKNLLMALENLDGHPVLSFPDNPLGQSSVELLAEFVIERSPGKFKKG